MPWAFGVWIFGALYLCWLGEVPWELGLPTQHPGEESPCSCCNNYCYVLSVDCPLRASRTFPFAPNAQQALSYAALLPYLYISLMTQVTIVTTNHQKGSLRIQPHEPSD